MKFFKKLWNWLDGKKSIIGAIAIMTVNSDYIATLISNPNLYALLQGIAGVIFGIGLLHKTVK